MPTSPASEREEAVVRDVAAAWRSATGLEITLVGWPDRERASGLYDDGLTVDAVLRVTDGSTEQRWAADVVSLTWNPRLPPAVKGFAEMLQAELEQVARRHERGVKVLFAPPIGHPDKGAAYRTALVKYVDDMLGQADPDRSPFVNDPNTHVTVADGPCVVDGERVVLSHVLALTPSTLTQVQDSLLPAVQSKLDGQLRRAHDLGHPTMLLIDQVGSVDLPHGVNFVVSPATVSQAVTSCVARHGHETGLHVLDFAALIRGDGCSPVYGNWPGVSP